MKKKLERNKMKLLIVLGDGGHTAELISLINLLGDKYSYEYIIAKEDYLSDKKIKYPGNIFKLRRPRGKNTTNCNAIYNTFINGINAILLLLRLRPYAIISSGPAIAVPVAFVGKLLNSKIIFVETGSRVTSLSLTGRIMYRFADLFFIQWPNMKENLPKAIYAGRLI